jgi:hypothetical protein
MNVQRNDMMARQRSTELRHAKLVSNRSAVRRRSRLDVDEYPHPWDAFGHRACGFGALVWASGRHAGGAGVVGGGAPSAVADPIGQMTRFSAGLNPGSDPERITPRADDNLWLPSALEGNLWLGDSSPIAGPATSTHIPTGRD